MRHKKLMLLSMLLAVIMANTLSAQVDRAYPYRKDIDEYYPMRPGKYGWKELDKQQRIEALKIPEGRLKQMETFEVYNAFLAYPFVSDFLWFGSIERGYKRRFENCSAFQELIKRIDTGKILLEHYHELDPDNLYENYENIGMLQRAEIKKCGELLDIILSHDEVLQNLSFQDKRRLAVLAYENVLKHKYTYQGYCVKKWKQTGLLLLGRLLKSNHNPELEKLIKYDNNLSTILQKGKLKSMSENHEATILKLTEKYINNQ